MVVETADDDEWDVVAMEVQEKEEAEEVVAETVQLVKYTHP